MTQALEAQQDQGRKTILDRVKRAVVEGLHLEMDPSDLADDESLFGDLGADSTAALEIVVAIEDEFGFEVEDEDLTVELMASVASLAAYVEAAVGEGPGGSSGDPTDERPSRPNGTKDVVEAADDVPVEMKACPNCGRHLERTGDPARPDCGGALDAAQHAGLESGICPNCGVQMMGAERR